MVSLVSRVKEELTLEKVLATAIKTPGVKIRRDVFLRKELKKYYKEDVIEEAIRYNPAKAGIPKSTINRIAKTVIDYETKRVSMISIVASMPSSAVAAVAAGAAATDITSYFVHVLRVVQELAYLYGFEQFDLNGDNVDSETMDYLLVFIGVMFDVQGASATLGKLSAAIAEQVQKKLSQRTFTKGTLLPIIKKIAMKVGVRMTKQIFADTIASAVPLAGSLLSGGLTYAMFKPNCIKLQKNLMTYKLCDPDFYQVVAEQ